MSVSPVLFTSLCALAQAQFWRSQLFSLLGRGCGMRDKCCTMCCVFFTVAGTSITPEGSLGRVIDCLASMTISSNVPSDTLRPWDDPSYWAPEFVISSCRPSPWISALKLGVCSVGLVWDQGCADFYQISLGFV